MSKKQEQEQEEKTSSRFFVNKTCIKHLLGSLGIGAESEAYPKLIDTAKKLLLQFGHEFGDALTKQHGNPVNVDRDHVPGDVQSGKAILFSSTPFANALRVLLKAKTGHES